MPLTEMKSELGGPGSGPRPRSSGIGTKDDPIITSDVKAAARALGEDKYVQLHQPEQVSTLLDELAATVADAKRMGQDAPNYDLCKVSVPGTNLFCSESLGVPRVKMPQLSGIPIPGSPADSLPKDAQGYVNIGPAFIDHMKSQGVDVTETTRPASYLRASQNELNGAKVAGIANAIESGAMDPEEARAIFTTKDDYVIDGHHRWAAAAASTYETGKDPNLNVNLVDTDIITALQMANDFATAQGIPGVGVEGGKGAFGGPGSGPRPGHRPPFPLRPPGGAEPKPKSKVPKGKPVKAPAPAKSPAATVEGRLLEARVPLTTEQTEAIAAYTGRDGEMINAALRRDDVGALDEARQKTVEQLDAVTNQPLPEAVTVHRAIHPVGDLWPVEEKLPAGAIVTDPAFMSTSLNPIDDGGKADGKAGYEVQLQLAVPAETRGVLIGPESVHPAEKEVLLARGTTYRIDSHEPDGTIMATVLPPPPSTASSDGSEIMQAMSVPEIRQSVRLARITAVFGGPGSGPRPKGDTPSLPWHKESAPEGEIHPGELAPVTYTEIPPDDPEWDGPTVRGSSTLMSTSGAALPVDISITSDAEQTEFVYDVTVEAEADHPGWDAGLSAEGTAGSLDEAKEAAWTEVQSYADRVMQPAGSEAAVAPVVFGGPGSGPQGGRNPNQAAIDQIKGGFKGTDEKYRNPGWKDGDPLSTKYTPERAALHAEVIAQYLNHVSPPEGQPRVVFLGGGPGAGKTSVVNSGLVDIPDANDGAPPADALLVNADKMKESLPEYSSLGELGDPATAAFSHEESSDMGKMLMAAGLEKGVNITVDGTGNNSAASMEKKIGQARDAGAKIEAVYVTIPTEVAVQRAEKRAADLAARGETPRVVPTEVIQQTHSGVSRVFPEIADQFDSVSVFSKMGAPDDPPVLLAEGGGGQLNVVDEAGYQEFLAKGSERYEDGVRVAAALGATFAAQPGGDAMDAPLMLADILNGKPYTTGDQAVWDRLVAEVRAIRKKYRGEVIIDIPFEIPDAEAAMDTTTPEIPEALSSRFSPAVQAMLDGFGGPGSGPRPGGGRKGKPVPKMKPGDDKKPGSGVKIPGKDVVPAKPTTDDEPPGTGRGGGSGQGHPEHPGGGEGDDTPPGTDPAIEALENELAAAAPEPVVDVSDPLIGRVDEPEVIADYTRNAATINEAMRTGEVLDQDALNQQSALINYLDRSSIPKDITVYRGMDLDPAVAGALVPGSSFQNPAFTSATLTPPGTNEGYPSPADRAATKVEISVPAGTKGAYIGRHSAYGDSEREVLFPPNLNLQVDSVGEDGLIRASVVEPHAPPSARAPRGGLDGINE